MQKIDSDSVAKIVISQFLSALMKMGRESLGGDPEEASRETGWSASAWQELEQGDRLLDRSQWMAAMRVLGLSISDVVIHLDGFIRKNPSLWVEKKSDNALTLCKRPVTSPRVLRSGNVLNVDLDGIRPNLFHQLSNYFDDAVEVITTAISFDYYGAKEIALPSSEPDTFVPKDSPERDRRELLVRRVRDLPRDKIGLMERVVDKFTRHPAKNLVRAYEHFSLSLKKL